mgnify:CR=1
MKNLGQNDLEELQDLMARIQNEISTYRHVREYLPKPLIDALGTFQSNLIKEAYRREKSDQ